MIRVLQFADLVNRHDFIDTIVQRADAGRFQVGVCVRSPECNIAEPVYEERTPRWVLGSASRRAVPQAAARLARLLHRWRADIIHAHHYDQAVIAWLATRLYPRTRLVIGRHYSDSIYRLPSRARQRALLVVEQAVNRAAARIVAPSSYIRDILTEWQGVRADKVDLVPYGFAAEKYEPISTVDTDRLRGELGLEGRFVLGNFARLHEEKGQRFLIEALSRLRQRVPRVALLVVGEGPERSRLEGQIRAAGLGDTVRLLGWRRDAMTLMGVVDAVVQSTLQEAFSQVMVEALWMRKPLVMTDVSGAADIIRDGENGFVVPKGDVLALASAIERLAADAPLCQRVSAAGREYVEQHLTVERIMPRYEQVYIRALEASGN
jgi:L-malate glycosyltransferase